MTKARTSVSAEAYGVWNKKEEFQPVVVPKSEAIKEKIRNRLNQSFMFGALEEKEFNIVIDAMKEVNFNENDVVIQQGADGDDLYVVESGTLSCHRVMAQGEAPTFLKNYEPGEAFGELALLYNAPRAATITAKTAA